MGRKTRPADYFRLIPRQTNPQPLSPPDFAWEILRRRADYHAGAAPARRVIGTHKAKTVNLIECGPPADPSWGLLFRGGPVPPGA